MTAARLLVSDYIADVTTIRIADIRSLQFDDSYFDAMRRIPLAACISAIIHETNAERGGISIIDGASEGEMYPDSNECEKKILKTMILLGLAQPMNPG